MSDLVSAPSGGRQLPPGGYWNRDSSLPAAMFRARRAGVDKDNGFYSDKAKPLSRPADKARKAGPKPTVTSGALGKGLWRGSRIIAMAEKRKERRFYMAWTGRNKAGYPWPDSFAIQASDKLLKEYWIKQEPHKPSNEEKVILAAPKEVKGAMVGLLKQRAGAKLERVQEPEKDAGKFLHYTLEAGAGEMAILFKDWQRDYPVSHTHSNPVNWRERKNLKKLEEDFKEARSSHHTSMVIIDMEEGMDLFLPKDWATQQWVDGGRLCECWMEASQQHPIIITYCWETGILNMKVMVHAKNKYNHLLNEDEGSSSDFDLSMNEHETEEGEQDEDSEEV
jgi:hypothetical protein